MKRNDLVERASGEFIVHFDDDDYYASSYISHLIFSMIKKNADCLKLSAFFIYDTSYRHLFYWDQTQPAGTYFVGPDYIKPPRTAVSMHNKVGLAKMLLGYGFTYVYRRSIWNSIKFSDTNFCEDLLFMARAAKTHPMILLPDTLGLCLHVLHSSNMSGCFPQYVIPPFMANTLFPQAGAYFLEWHQEHAQG
jgi:glycosyltransferase involved in cell wall biosynthesis